jgi:tetratricopeptide (TPR) repeat protein
MALYGLGSIGEYSGAFGQAKQYFLESLDLFRAANRPDGIASSLDKLGLVAFTLGEYEESETYYQESLDLFQQSNNRMGISLALGGLGLVAWGRGGSELVQARELYEKSLALCRETGQRGQLVIRLANLSHICNALEAHDLAQTYCQEAIVLGREVDFRIGVSLALSALGEALAAQGEFKSARAALIESIEIAVSTNDYAELFSALVSWVEYLLRPRPGNANFSTARQQQLLDILTLALNHPSNRQVFRDKAARLLSKLELTLSNDRPVKVKTSPDLPDLDTVAAEILRSL